jgi:uncharacterized protein
MSSVNPKIHEPSMEEILASIRRIIADDQETLQSTQDFGHPGGSSPLKNVLDLVERQASPMPSLSLPDHEHEDADFESADDDYDLPNEAPATDFGSVYKIEQFAPQPTAPSRQAPPMRAPQAVADEALLSARADASVSEAFTRLGATMAKSSPKTMEDIVKEMLRPMLKAWLDDNLPPLVERLVEAEIERVARGKR